MMQQFHLAETLTEARTRAGSSHSRAPTSFSDARRTIDTFVFPWPLYTQKEGATRRFALWGWVELNHWLWCTGDVSLVETNCATLESNEVKTSHLSPHTFSTLGKQISRTSAWPLPSKKTDSSLQKGDSNGTILSGPVKAEKAVWVCTGAPEAKLLCWWPCECRCPGSSRDWSWVCLGLNVRSMSMSYVASGKLSKLSAFVSLCIKKKECYLYRSVNIALNDVILA